MKLRRPSLRRPSITSRVSTAVPPLVLAHQGLDHHGAKNTLKAFRQAIEAGATFLETDAQATKDGVVVAFHDDRLDPSSDGHGLLSEATWADLSRVRVGGEPIPQLREVLDAFPEAFVNIDVKAETVVEPLATMLADAEREAPGTLARVLIASFSDQRRRAVLRRLPRGVATSGGTGRVVLLWFGSRLWGGPLNFLGRPLCAAATRGLHAFQVPRRHWLIPIADARFVNAAHGQGTQVHVWTINDEPTMVRLLNLGVDGIVTDRCDIALRVIADRADTGSAGPHRAGPGTDDTWRADAGDKRFPSSNQDGHA